MYLTREIIQRLLDDPEQFRIVNLTDHAEWFSGLKETRVFDFNAGMDVWSNTPGLVFETSKGLFGTSPEGKVFKIDTDVEVGVTGSAMEVRLTPDGLRAQNVAK